MKDLTLASNGLPPSRSRSELAATIVPPCTPPGPPETAELHARVARLEAALRDQAALLAEREGELGALLADSPLLQGVLSPDGTVLRISDRVRERTGIDPADLIGRAAWHAPFWPDQAARNAVEEAVRHAVHSGEPVQWHSMFVAASGVRHQGHFSIRPYRATDGRVELLLATARDFTEEEGIRNALAEGERRYLLLLSNLPGIVFRAQAAAPWHIEYLSEGARRLTGYPVEHFVVDGHPFASIVVDEDREPLAQTLADQAAAGQPMRCEYRIRRQDGTVRWVEGQARMAEDDPSKFEGTIFDIDDRKRAELALQESQAHFHYITQNSPSVLWTAGPQGNIEFISDAYVSQFGRPREELLERGWQDLLHPDDVERVRARWLHSLQTGDHYEIGFRLLDMDGHYRSFQASGHCRRDDACQIRRWYGVLTNVDELVRTQAQLRESEELARATLETCPGMVWRALPDGSLDFVSEGCVTLLGWSSSEILERQWLQLLHPDEVQDVSQRYQHALQTGEDFASRHRFRCADGGFRWFEVHATARRAAQGPIVGWFGLATCIDELLQARFHAEAAARAKAAFLSTMSHEIRTPLNAVLGFAGLLGDSQLDPSQRECVDAIASSGAHLLGVINDILDFSKLESGGMALDYAACDPRGLVESALDLIARQAAYKGLELYCSFDEALPDAVVIDAARLRQVLANLLSNAVKFTDRGEVEVRAQARVLSENQVELTFSVRDTGIGIADGAVDRLFQDFSQGDDSVARRFGGTGLGLAISKRLVEAHGGSIEVESVPYQGSVFRFRVPARVVPALGAGPAPVDRLRGRRLLVIDDHRPTLEALGQQLRRWQIDVVLVTDPRVAVATAQQADTEGVPFDLALVDQRMPHLDGVSVARALKVGAGVPVVLLCEWGGARQVQQVAADLLAGVQTKPLHREALIETLCKALSLHATPTLALRGQDQPIVPLRLLVVEDNAVNRKLVMMLLKKIGYDDVQIAVDGLEAIDAVARRPYDVVLMDVQMPRLDGLAATRRIRTLSLAWPQPHIVAMTANAMTEDREACMAAGMNEYLSKPIPRVQLEAVLRRAGDRVHGENGSVRAG